MSTVEVKTVLIKGKLYIREDSVIDILRAGDVVEENINILKETLLKIRYE